MVKRISNDRTEEKDKGSLSGVYKLSCKQCEGIYIGETGRKFRSKKTYREKEKMGSHRLTNAAMNNSNGEGIFEVIAASWKPNLVEFLLIREKVID